MGLIINTDRASITKPIIHGQEKPIAGRKIAMKQEEKKIEHPQPTPEQIELYKKARATLSDLGFILNISYGVPFSDFIKAQLPFQLVRIYVGKKESIDKLSREFSINPNYFVVVDWAKDKTTAIVRLDITNDIYNSIIIIYAEKHKISLKNEKQNTNLAWEIIRKLTEGDPEVTTIALKVKDKYDKYNPLLKWNALNPKVGNCRLRFVGFHDFISSASNQPKIPLNREMEEFIFSKVNYRIKSSENLLSILKKEAEIGKIDLAKMPPDLAIYFAARVAEKYMRYNYKMTTGWYGQGYSGIDRHLENKLPDVVQRIKTNDQGVMDEYQAENRKIDNRGADEILLNQLGVCRNYAEVFNAILYTLKSLNPNLSNLYSTGIISDSHEWVMVVRVEEKNGKKELVATMIDPTADDADKIFGNDLDASESALNKYATAFLLVRLNRMDDFKRLLNANENDPNLQIAMLQALAQKDLSKEESFKKYEELSHNILKSKKCIKSHEFAVRKGLAYAYLERGKFDKALEQFNILKSQPLSHIDKHEENLFLAKLYYAKGDLPRAEVHATKCTKYLHGKLLLTQILFTAGKNDEAIVLLNEIEKSYDYSEFKLSTRLIIAEILALNDHFVESKKYLADSEKYCRVRAERFAFMLSRARIERESGKTDTADALFAKITQDYPVLFEKNLTDIYKTTFNPEDLVELIKIALKRKDNNQASKILIFLMTMAGNKAVSYIIAFADAFRITAQILASSPYLKIFTDAYRKITQTLAAQRL